MWAPHRPLPLCCLIRCYIRRMHDTHIPCTYVRTCYGVHVPGVVVCRRAPRPETVNSPGAVSVHHPPHTPSHAGVRIKRQYTYMHLYESTTTHPKFQNKSFIIYHRDCSGIYVRFFVVKNWKTCRPTAVPHHDINHRLACHTTKWYICRLMSIAHPHCSTSGAGLAGKQRTWYYSSCNLFCL